MMNMHYHIRHSRLHIKIVCFYFQPDTARFAADIFFLIHCFRLKFRKLITSDSKKKKNSYWMRYNTNDATSSFINSERKKHKLT